KHRRAAQRGRDLQDFTTTEITDGVDRHLGPPSAPDMEGNTAPYRLHRERNSAHDRPDSRRWHQCCPLNPAETSACPVSKAAFRNLAREGAPVEECVCDGM